MFGNSSDAMDSFIFKVPLPPPPPPRKVSYIYDKELSKCTDNIAHIRDRSEMVHELIKSYGLLKLMDWKSSILASRDDLLKFHSKDYVDFLFEIGGVKESEEGMEDGDLLNSSFPSNYGISSEVDMDEFGLGYDCPVFKGLVEFAKRIAGGTMTAAKCILEGAEVAINWSGGWHHAQRSEASGFCYVNDIVLGIHLLQKRFKHILYIDLDAHHGDGVENAFAFSEKVMTLSFHHYETGYFPGTGKLTDVGQGRGRYCSLNVPLKAGVVDHQFKFLFDSIIHTVIQDFKPDALVVQCGADCLALDPLGAFNLTGNSIIHCIRTIFNLTATDSGNVPILMLGGGGYNVANAARLWTSLTAEALNRRLSNDIPDSDEYFLKYGPDFELAIQPSLRKNENDEEYINDLIKDVTSLLGAFRKRKEMPTQ